MYATKTVQSSESASRQKIGQQNFKTNSDKLSVGNSVTVQSQKNKGTAKLTIGRQYKNYQQGVGKITNGW